MLCYSINSYAQKSTQLSGYFKENYRVLQLSKQIQRLLFVKMKGNVVVPEYAYYLNLIPADAERLGLKDVLIISNGGEDYVQSGTSLQKINAIPLSNLENGIFIDISKRKITDEKLISILKNPRKTDTLNHNSIYSTNDFRLTKQWIDVIDNINDVTVAGTMYISLTSGEDISRTVYDLTPINKLAKTALHNIENLFDLANTQEWTKSQWQNWFEKTTGQGSDVENLAHNAETFIIPDTFKDSFPNVALYGKDDLSKKILAVESLRYNVNDFEGHQIIRLDNAKVDKSDYYRTNQQQLFGLEAFKSIGDDLFVISKYNTWAHLRYQEKTQQYNIQAHIKIELPKVFNMKGDNEIKSVQMGEKLSYVLLKNKISKSLFALTLNTSTGEVLFTKKLEELLPMIKGKDLDFVSLKYGTEIPDGFLFGVRDEKKYYLIKTSANLADAKVSETSSMIQNSTAFVHSNNLDIINLENGFLRRISFDASLSHQLSKTQRTDFKDNYYDEDGTITHDGKNYQIFFSYHLPLHSGIKMYTLNHQFKPIKAQSIFNFLEVEEPTSDNMVHLLYASKLENHLWLFFKMGTDLRYTKIIDNRH